MTKTLLIITYIFLASSSFAQWVNPRTNRPSEIPDLRGTSPEVSDTFSSAPQIRYREPSSGRGTAGRASAAAPSQSASRPVREITDKKKLFKKLLFTFDGKIKLLEPTINRDLAELYIVTFNAKKKPVLIEFDGRRPFKIKIEYDKKGKPKSLLWSHFDKDFLKFDFGKPKRFFIKINIFNFIRTTKALLLPQLDVYEKKHFLRMSKDKFKRMAFKLEAKRHFARSLNEYYIAYFNKDGLWNIAQKYEKYGSKFMLKKVYYCIYDKNAKVKNLRVFDVDADASNSLDLDRSYFYDYESLKRISVWEIYITEEEKYWEILLERWIFDYKNGKRYTKERKNTYTDNFLKSAYVVFHFKPWLTRSDDFSSHSNYLRTLGMGGGSASILGSAMSVFIPTIKGLFVTIEVGWDGLWDRKDNYRYTLNLFNISANTIYILPVYQDTILIGVYGGGGIGIMSADYTQYYNSASLTLEKQKAATRIFFLNIRLGVCLIWKAGIIGLGLRYYHNIGSLKDFTDGKGHLWYSPSEGLRVYAPGSQPSDAHSAAINMKRFSFDIFIGIRI